MACRERVTQRTEREEETSTLFTVEEHAIIEKFCVGV